MPVEAKDTHNVYHNVFSFTRRLLAKSDSIDTKTLRENIDSCLIGAAETWYTNELTSLTRAGRRSHHDGMKQWIEILEERFRDSPGTSLKILEKIRYTINDVRERRDPATYVANIIAHS